MSAQLLNGAPVAEAVLADLAVRVKALTEAGHQPGLATLIVGDRPDSVGYVRKKHELCAELGVASFHEHLPEDAAQADVLAAVRGFNDESGVDGLLFQYPPPDQIDYPAAILAMDPEKDADGMHPLNIGRLVAGDPGPIPNTPAGIEAMLAHYDVPVAGKHVVVLGRGVTLGRPLSILLSLKRPTANAAVTVVHTGVPNWQDYTREADVVVAGVGVPGIVKPEHVREGAAVIGAGITYVGKRIQTDVDEACGEVAGWITPRVGGVGPTTLAMLLRNVIEAAERRHGS